MSCAGYGYLRAVVAVLSVHTEGRLKKKKRKTPMGRRR
jgi:hypothetical protein